MSLNIEACLHKQHFLVYQDYTKRKKISTLGRNNQIYRRKIYRQILKETIKPVVSKKHEFENQDESILKKFLDDHDPKSGMGLIVLQTQSSSKSRNFSIATLMVKIKPAVMER